MPAPDQIAFGKQPKNSDPRTVLLSLWLRDGLLTGQEAPKGDDSVHNEGNRQDWDPLGNNQHQDCAIAAAGHAEMLWAELYDKPMTGPTTDQILDEYAKITGYDPNDPATDKGANLLSVLRYWQKKGIAGQTIGAFAEILPPDIDTIKWAIKTLGLAYVGFRLSASWVAPKVPDIKADFTTRRWWPNPATWKNRLYGHCVIYTGFGPDRSFTCVSWGKLMTVSEQFHKAYCDEAYAILAPEQVADSDVAANPGVRKLKGAVRVLQS